MDEVDEERFLRHGAEDVRQAGRCRRLACAIAAEQDQRRRRCAASTPSGIEGRAGRVPNTPAARCGAAAPAPSAGRARQQQHPVGDSGPGATHPTAHKSARARADQHDAAPRQQRELRPGGRGQVGRQPRRQTPRPVDRHRQRRRARSAISASSSETTVKSRRDRVTSTSSCTPMNVTPISCRTSTARKARQLPRHWRCPGRRAAHRKVQRVAEQDEQAEAPARLTSAGDS